MLTTMFLTFRGTCEQKGAIKTRASGLPLPGALTAQLWRLLGELIPLRIRSASATCRQQAVRAYVI
jgi:hypothetical protein